MPRFICDILSDFQPVCIWKTEACGQTMLPDRSLIIGQKLVESTKKEKFQCDNLGDFQPL